MIRRWLAAFAFWLLRLCGYPGPVSAAMSPHVVAMPAATVDALPRARALVTETASIYGENRSGENLRHLVYSRLIKEFPSSRRRDLALALEIAVRSLP